MKKYDWNHFLFIINRFFRKDYHILVQLKTLFKQSSYTSIICTGIDGDSKELRRFVAAKAMKMKRHLVDMSSVSQEIH